MKKSEHPQTNWIFQDSSMHSNQNWNLNGHREKDLFILAMINEDFPFASGVQSN